jgi:hypothetical protein
MDSNLGRAGFRIGVFVVLLSGGLLLVLQKGTAEYLLMQVMFVLGLIFLGVIVLAVRLSLRK